MNQNKLFNSTRWRLALSYAGVMAVILSVSGIAVYRAMSYFHWIALDRELESVVGTLHDNLEMKLQQPGRLEPIAQELLSNLCIVGSSCIQEQSFFKRHVLGKINQSNYYVRFFDNSGRLIGTTGNYPDKISKISENEIWQTLKDGKGNLYHQVSLLLHTQDNNNWGYMHVGRNLEDFERELATLRWILGLGLPMVMGLVGVASWQLAGLAMKPIYQSYQQIQQFTADAAHELRTPLAATQATVESALLMPQLDEAETRDILQILQRQNQRLTTLVADLLLLARIDKQPQAVQRELCCLNEIISDLIEEFSAMALTSGVTLKYYGQAENLINVVGDSDKLYRLVANLIVNAIQYTPKGGQVTVFLNRNDHHAVIKVQDTGIGIPQKEQTRIFDRFYRVNSDRSRSTGGSGLGLAIAFAIVQVHHGSLNVQSELGKGSTFTVQLPLDVTPVKSDRSVSPLTPI
ncbi:HAMP domain-containing histidine kinase [Nostoc sp. CHAB 5834]|nr:HAMP domain-containing histidine kinase [Nostoc sp. CHAB 5834]